MGRIVIALVTGALIAQGAMADPAQTTTGNSPQTSPPAPPPIVVPLTMPPDPTPPNAATPTQENSPGYVEGYSDGCASANLRYARQVHVKPNKDAKLYDGDKDYHDGWDHGYRKCEDKITPGGLSVPGNSVVL